MTYAIEAQDLGKRYGRRWALRNCDLQLPSGKVSALVGLNGAGKTTLLHLAMGLLKADEGTIQVQGKTPSSTEMRVLEHVGFVAQDHPLYHHLAVHELLTLGRKLNASWDKAYALALLERLSIEPKRAVGKLSGGQQAQVALIMAIAKRPALLILDEPFANVDPLARQEFIKVVMEAVENDGISVVLSSNQISDIDVTCDYLVLLSASQVQMADEIEQIVAEHKLLTGPHERADQIMRRHHVIKASQSGRQSNILIRADGAIDNQHWQTQDVSLEEIILAYLALQKRGVAVATLPPPTKEEVTQ